MSKYNIGDEISISGKIKITGMTLKKDGSYTYQTDHAFSAHETALERLVNKPAEPPKPAFVEGGHAKVTGNTNHHHFKIGETITLLHKYGCKYAYWEACASTDISAIWNVKESDMTPCEAPKAKAEPTYKFKVGDKVIGNEKANARYGYTRQGWTGVVTSIDKKKFTAQKAPGETNYPLEYDYFDLYEEPATPTEPPKQPEKPAKLVDRDAKVGEKIFINKAEGTNGAYKNGDICEVVKTHEHNLGGVYIKSPTGQSNTMACESGTAYVNRSEYLVVDEPKKAKLYSGKVICVENGARRCWTVGKAYQVTNGIIKDDDGDTRLAFASLQELNSRYTDLQFIEAVD